VRVVQYHQWHDLLELGAWSNLLSRGLQGQHMTADEAALLKLLGKGPAQRSRKCGPEVLDDGDEQV
jgi:hypothetical protein